MRTVTHHDELNLKVGPIIYDIFIDDYYIMSSSMMIHHEWKAMGIPSLQL